MLRMTGGWTSLDAGRKFSDTNCGFPQRSQPQSPPVLENFDHIVGPQFSRKISEIWANFLVAFVFSQNCANFHAISISQKSENFLAVKIFSKTPGNCAKFLATLYLTLTSQAGVPFAHRWFLLPLFSQLQIIVNWQRDPTNASIPTQLPWNIFHHQRRDTRHRIFWLQ